MATFKFEPRGKRARINPLLITLGFGTIGWLLWKYRSRLPGPSASETPPNPPIPIKRDQVDEASWESFPASDPPGF